MSGHPYFVCPICCGALFLREKSLCCDARHTFDVARQGYVNLLARQTSGLYGDQALFMARRAVYEAGFFHPVMYAIREMTQGGGVMLDAGCGEGSLLYGVLKPGQAGIGLDIAKRAVAMAAGRYKGIHWCVGDLCAMPLRDASVDTLLNVLTPANYHEFARVLKRSGTFVKVTPNPGHLAEIRELVGKAAPSAEAEFPSHLRLVDRRTVRYTVPCDTELYACIYAMTPLTANIPREGAAPRSVTVDVTIQSGGFT